MLSFNLFKRYQQFLSRLIFRFLFSGKFKEFGKKTTLVSPDKIEGEEYISLEDGVSINTMAWLLALKNNEQAPQLVIRRGTIIGRFSHIVAVRHVEIASNVLIADKVYISDNIHDYHSVTDPVMKQSIIFKSPVIIGENSWLGENVSVIGAKIGKHCVIGANSVVTKDIPDYSIAVGIPAKVIKRYNHNTEEWQKVKSET